MEGPPLVKKALSVAMLLLLVVVVAPAWAAHEVTTTGTTVNVPDNCGFTVMGTTDGWVRLYLVNDVGQNVSGSDFWVIAGEYYPLRVATVLIPTDQEVFGNRPSGLSFDTSQTCGYTRSFGLDECGNYPFGDVAANVGIYATSTGSIEVKWRTDTENDPWRLYQLHAGEFALGDVATCQLVEGSNLGYITMVAP